MTATSFLIPGPFHESMLLRGWKLGPQGCISKSQAQVDPESRPMSFSAEVGGDDLDVFFLKKKVTWKWKDG